MADLFAGGMHQWKAEKDTRSRGAGFQNRGNVAVNNDKMMELLARHGAYKTFG